MLPYGPLTQAEKDALEAMLPTLRDEIRMGEEFILQPEKFEKSEATSK